MKLLRKLTTKESRAYWAFVERVGREVEKMPKWMKGGPSKRAAERTTP